MLFVSLFIISSSCYLDGSGFRPFELSARATALGGAFVALAEDASAVFYNPAGLAFSSGIMLNTNIYYPRTKFTTDYPISQIPYHSNLGKLLTAYFISANLLDRIGLGIGVFIPNSMETNWPENWTERALSIHSKLNTLYIRPMVAVKIAKFLSIGAGIDFISSNVTWKYQRIFTFRFSKDRDERDKAMGIRSPSPVIRGDRKLLRNEAG